MKPGPSNINTKKGLTKFLTPKLFAVLDKCEISDSDAIHIIISTAEALGKNVPILIKNRKTIQRELLKRTSKNFLIIIVLHWDGKLLPNICGKEKVDRLPVIVSFDETTQLLGVPKLESGTGI